MSRSTVPSKRSAETQEAAWVADEDRFVLQQAKKKAAIRVKGGRAQPIDRLAVTLAVIDPERNALDDEGDTSDLDLVDPETVFDGLDDRALDDLEKGIDSYIGLESSRSNVEFWKTMKTICQDQRQRTRSLQASARGVKSVAGDLDKLLGPKNLEELEKLEKQVQTKLASNQPIDTDYWEHLLKSLLVYKAKAKLRSLSQAILQSRLEDLRKQQAARAVALKARLEALQPPTQPLSADAAADAANGSSSTAISHDGRHALDPEPLLRLQADDKTLVSMTDGEFADKLEADRRRVAQAGYIVQQKRVGELTPYEPTSKRVRSEDDAPAVSSVSAFDREVARGLGENEELLTTEEPVITKNRASWANVHRPRKPKYFNRVILGYEWNKYNQTHYDHDHPPPRVVQGYRFNIFYPDLVDKHKAPTYRIEREDGRRRGESFAPAGEDDTCIIRFIGGAPYEDIAFRIVDREWDYSAKRERGFKSSFDKGILQLYFQFKKIYYRK